MQIDNSKVTHVYSGIDGRCCCGCSGKYTYAKAHQDLGTNRRGYTVHDNECNDRTVKMITNKINKNESIQEVINGSNELIVSIVVGKRLYMAVLPA